MSLQAGSIETGLADAPVSRRRYERERAARLEAEQLLEAKSRALYEANLALAAQARRLEAEVQARTAELDRARRTAEAANRAKSAFLAAMSHELRTPLNGIIGICEALMGALQDPAARRQAEIILASGEALLELLNDILDLSKIEAEKMELAPAPFALRPLLERIATLHRIKAEEKGIDLRLETEGALPEAVLGDAQRVGQILHNLLSNAVKFTSRGGVRMTVARDFAGHVVFRVADSGIGMTEDQRARLFNRFEQADETIAARYGGTGLGMAIVKELVALMKGVVEVRSTPGEGTEITVTLPLAQARLAPARPEARPDAGVPDLSGLRVLAADDNALNREILAALMAPTGLALTLATDGQEAAEVFAADPSAFDLVILDISMPRLDGPSALAAMKDIARAAGRPDVPAIALTANAMEDQHRAYREAGFAACLTKPFKRRPLAELILETLANG